MITKNKPFIIFQYVLMAVLVIVVIIPFWLLIASSLTTEEELIHNGYSLFPSTISFDAYKYLLVASGGVAKAYLMSVVISAIGVTANLLLTILYAYPLSRTNLFGKAFFAFYLFFTMLFNGGLVPTYMIYSNVFHIKDTLPAMIVPGLMMSAFHVIMMRTYITTNVSNEIVEAAKIDGAGEFKCLIKVVIPLCKPIIGTLALMTFIGYWNNWTNGIYYIQKRTDLWGIQNYMKSILDSVTTLQEQIARGYQMDFDAVPSIGIRMALAVIAVLPVMIIYPFFQKSFVKGITIGSVKG